MKSLLISLVLLPDSFAYVTSSPAPHQSPATLLTPKPRLVPTSDGEIGKPQQEVPMTSTSQQQQTQQRVKYDLGLGKNPPVTRKAGRKTKTRMSTSEATRFWMIPEAVNNYPSPLLSKEAGAKLEQIVPSRMSLDAVDISGKNKDATAVLQVNPVDLEMNTLWVEMLIHHQQNKMLSP